MGTDTRCSRSVCPITLQAGVVTTPLPCGSVAIMKETSLLLSSDQPTAFHREAISSLVSYRKRFCLLQNRTLCPFLIANFTRKNCIRKAIRQILSEFRSVLAYGSRRNQSPNPNVTFSSSPHLPLNSPVNQLTISQVRTDNSIFGLALVRLTFDHRL